jgi:hypothetical protein
MLFREITAVYTKNHTNSLCGHIAKPLIFKTGGTYSYHWALNGSHSLSVFITILTFSIWCILISVADTS